MNRLILDWKLFDPAHSRMRIAAACALVAHAMVLMFGLLIIDWHSIPSNMNRVLLLTLQPAEYDGYAELESPLAETINDVETDVLPSSPEQSSTYPDSPDSKPIAPAKPKIEPTSVSNAPVEDTTAPTPETLTSANLANPDSGSQADSPVEPTAVEQTEVISAEQTTTEQFEQDLSDPDALLATEGRSGEVAQPVTTPPSGSAAVEKEAVAQADDIPLSPQQQEMMANKLDEFAASAELSDRPNEPVSWQHNGQHYTAEFSHLPADSEMALDELRIRVVTEQDGRQLSAEMRAKKLAFSHFAQFVHRWDPDLLVHDDELTGRFHSNSPFFLEYDRQAKPVFNGKVTTASNRISMTRANRGLHSSIFKGGIETGVRKIRMPKPELWFTESAYEARTTTHYLEDNSRVLFDRKGIYRWQSIGENESWQSREIGDQTVYLIAAPGKRIHVSGEIRGRIMIYSPLRIVIEGNLTYANGKPTDPAGDFLGLVSDRNVVIDKPSVTGSGDLEIHGSIYARGRFLVRNSDSPHSGTLSIFGSLSAGSLSATEPRFATSIVFDERLEDVRPPGFPMTDRYELAQGDGVWQPQLRADIEQQ